MKEPVEIILTWALKGEELSICKMVKKNGDRKGQIWPLTNKSSVTWKRTGCEECMLEEGATEIRVGVGRV